MAFFKKNEDEGKIALNALEKKYKEKMRQKEEKDARIRERDKAYNVRERTVNNQLHTFKVPDDYLDNVRKKK